MLLLTELYDVVLCSTHSAHDVFIGVRLDYKEAATVCKVSLKSVCDGRVMEVSLVFILQKNPYNVSRIVCTNATTHWVVWRSTHHSTHDIFVDVRLDHKKAAGICKVSLKYSNLSN